MFKTKTDHTLFPARAIGAIFLCVFLLSAPARAEIPEDKSAAVIFSYHAVGDEAGEDVLPLEQFRAHVAELRKGGFAVLPLGRIVAALQGAAPLPAKAVAITFDNPSRATLDAVLPVLEEQELPYTLFIAADTTEWKKIKSLRRSKLASLGLLPAAYARLAGLAPEKSAAVLNSAVARYREELGEAPAFFAWPYGEYGAALEKQLAAYNFKAAFGQQSGVVHPGSDLLALPRFTMTAEFGNIERFRITAGALPLPVGDVTPGDAVLAQNPPRLGFTVTQDLHDLSRLSCFASGLGKLDLKKLAGGRVEIRLAQPLSDRRTRINCTLPAEDAKPGEPRGWRWLGFLLTLPGEDEDDDENNDGGDGGTEQN